MTMTVHSQPAADIDEGEVTMTDTRTSVVGTVPRPDGTNDIVVLPDSVDPTEITGFVEWALVPKAEFDALVALCATLAKNIEFRKKIGSRIDPERAIPAAFAAIDLARSSGSLPEEP
jgi:hypothetical protein